MRDWNVPPRSQLPQYLGRWARRSVKRVKSFGDPKVVVLADESSLALHRYACVGPGDELLVAPKGGHQLYVQCKNGVSRLRPVYRSQEALSFGVESLEVTYKEIETPEEFNGYEKLSDFHYRGVTLHGRRVPIVATVTHPLLPRVVGYVELSTSFLMNKPRARVLDGSFSDGNGIAWKAWDLSAMRKKTNLIVRVARCVVYPELRGLGLGRRLLRQAFRYARNHWQVGGLKHS